MLQKVKRLAIKTLKIDVEDVEKAKDDTDYAQDNKNAPQAITTRIKGNGGAVFMADGTENEYIDSLQDTRWTKVLQQWGLK